jgi:hypothetical protein
MPRLSGSTAATPTDPWRPSGSGSMKRTSRKNARALRGSLGHPALLLRARDSDSPDGGSPGWQRPLPRWRRRPVETLVERCAGLDVHKDSVTACVRVPDGHGGRQVETRRFTTTTAGLVLLAQWLASLEVTRVGMESTGCYWKPVWQLLEDQVECWLLNAAHLHNVPGRKTDVADAAWIAQLVEHGLVRPSFVPPRPIRELRELTRYRKTQIQARSREVQRPGQGPTRRRDPSCRVWPPTSSGPPAGPCCKPWWPAPMTRRCWPPWPRAGCGPSCQRCGRRWPAGSGPIITGCWWPRSWPTSTT